MPKAMSDWIAKNLWAILALIGGIAQGYNVGTSAMATMKADIDGIKAEQAKARQFQQCLIRTVDWIKSKSNDRAPCELE